MDRAAAGDEVVVTRHGTPVVRLSPAPPPAASPPRTRPRDCR